MIDDGTEREKLLRARHEISEVLKCHDVCGDVFLIGRHRMEVLMHLGASWSNLSLVRDAEGNEGIRLRSKLTEYQGDKQRQRQDLEATCGMVRALGELLARAALAWLAAAEQFDAATGAEHTPLTKDHKQ